jgi:hypothetical protein|tara:strand:- start:439 stop:552 length:114 start_codon:yes stop_codon:yes gene_type:complete
VVEVEFILIQLLLLLQLEVQVVEVFLVDLQEKVMFLL